MGEYKPLRAAFGNKSRVGKDECCSHCGHKHKSNCIRIAEPVYDISEMIRTFVLTARHMQLESLNILTTKTSEYLVKRSTKEIQLFNPSIGGRILKFLNRKFLPEFLKRERLTIEESGKEEDRLGNFNIKGAKCGWLLQLVGNGMREYIDEDLWVKIAEIRIQEMLSTDPKASITIPDLRYPNEAAMLKKHGFILIRVNRKNRVIDRDPKHPSETALDNFTGWDAEIQNDYSLEILHMMVDHILNENRMIRD
jgi:hypothetical protein